MSTPSDSKSVLATITQVTPFNTANILRSLHRTEFGVDVPAQSRAQGIIADMPLGRLCDPENPKNKKESDRLEKTLKDIAVDVLPQIQRTDAKNGSANAAKIEERIRVLRSQIFALAAEEQAIPERRAQLKSQRDHGFQAAYTKLIKEGVAPQSQTVVFNSLKAEIQNLEQQYARLNRPELEHQIEALCIDIKALISSEDLTTQGVAALNRHALARGRE